MSGMAEDPILRFLEERNVGFTIQEGGHYDHKIVEFRYTAKHTNIDCMIHYSEGTDVFTIYAMTPDEYDMELRPEMVKIVNDANFGRRYGAMIAGPPTGKKEDKFNIWCRLSSAGATDSNIDLIIDSMISNACGTLADYYPALMKVVWGELKAEDAIKFAFTEDNENEDESTPAPVVTGYQ